MKNIKKISIICSLSMVLAIIPNDIYATDETYNPGPYISFDIEGNMTSTPYQEVNTVDENKLDQIDVTTYKIVDENGETIDEVETKDEAEQVVKNLNKELPLLNRAIKAMTLTQPKYTVVDEMRSIAFGVLDFKNINQGTTAKTTPYTNARTGQTGYLYAPYAPDAAYLGMKGGKVVFYQAGVVGLIDPSLVNVATYDDYTKAGYITSYYEVKNGKIYHKLTTNCLTISSTQIVGYNPGYLKEGEKYFSYDGHYFYTDFNKMASNYREGHFNDAVNKDQKYYNYFQFLPHRSKTNFTANQINEYLNANIKEGSKLKNTGASFIESQNEFGINAILMLGVAINESGWGISSIAQNKNNLFGHGAVDSNPYGGANGYAKPSDSIKYHADVFLSRGYTYVNDSRYYGTHLGDKESGANVKYASDSYWGEKAATHGYYMEEKFINSPGGKYFDYKKEKVQFINGDISVYGQQNTSDESWVYSTGSAYGANAVKPTNELPIIVLATEKEFYKIQSDTVLNDTKTEIIEPKINGGLNPNYQYNFTDDVAYIKKSDVDGSKPLAFPKPDPVIPLTSEEYKLGDVNMDGKLTVRDYVLIQLHLMKTSELSDKQLILADLDGKKGVTVRDYVLIQLHLGKQQKLPGWEY